MARSIKYVNLGLQSPLSVQNTMPSNTDVLWLDTSEDTRVIKYHNGSEWVEIKDSTKLTTFGDTDDEVTGFPSVSFLRTLIDEHLTVTGEATETGASGYYSTSLREDIDLLIREAGIVSGVGESIGVTSQSLMDLETKIDSRFASLGSNNNDKYQIDGSNIVSGSITNGKIDDDAVTTGKIKDKNVTTDKIDGGAVTTGKINSSAISSQSEAQAGTNNDKIMTPLRTEEAITSHVPPLITTAKSDLRGGVSSSYDTLQKLYTYSTDDFYNRVASENRYERNNSTISGTRISTGINAVNVSTGTLATGRIPDLNANKITTGSLDVDRIEDNSITADKIKIKRISENVSTTFSLTGLRFRFTDSSNSTTLGSGHDLIMDIDLHYFWGVDGSQYGGFSGRYVHLIPAYPIFTGSGIVQNEGIPVNLKNHATSIQNEVDIQNSISFTSSVARRWVFTFRTIHTSVSGGISSVVISGLTSDGTQVSLGGLGSVSLQ